MKLSKSKIIGFIPCQNMDAAKTFYSDLLGLKLVKSDNYALEYKFGDISLRVTKVSKVLSADYTILGWEVDDIYLTVKELSGKGVEFIRYEGMNQDEMGICIFPGSSKVAWFKNPDGSTLSLTQFDS